MKNLYIWLGRFISMAVALVFVFVAAGCGDSTPKTATSLVSVEVDAPKAQLAVGTSQQYAAVAMFSDGSTQDVTATAVWSSSDATVVTVSNTSGSSGFAQTVKRGSVVISATFAGIKAGKSLTVTAAVLSRIDVTPANPSLPKGVTKQLTATGVFTDGTTQDLTTSATWTSSNSTAVAVSDVSGTKGLAVANSVGSANISAAYQSFSGSTAVTVTSANLISIQLTPTNPILPIGFTRPFTATGIYSDSTTQDITQQVTWGSTAPAVATISNAAGNQGISTGVSAGSTTITAQQASITGQTSLTVTSATLSTIQVTPANPSIALGTKQQFAATGTFSDSTTLDLTRQVTWTTGDATVATVSNAASSVGLATSVATGSTAITATHVGTTKSGSANLTVTPKELTSISVTPSTSSVAKGNTSAFTATGTYTDSSTADITTAVTWSPSDATIASISNAAGSNGVATSKKKGVVTITAAQGSVSGTATLTVTDAVLASINVTPALVSVPQGLKQQYTATGVYSDSSTQDLTKSVTWASDALSVATISNASPSNGLATTLSIGTANISATSGAISGSASLTVTSVALISIAITPSNANLPNGQSLQYTATGNYSDGSSKDLTATATWSSSNASIADVSNAAGSQGLAIAKALGQVTVSAVDPTTMVSGSTKLNVTAAQLVGITVAATSGATTVAASYSSQYVATAQYSDSTHQDVTATANWSSFNSSVATVDNAAGNKGLVHGVAAGTTNITATIGTTTGSASVTVTTAKISSIAIEPANDSVPKGETKQFSAIATFTDSSVSDVTTQITWGSSNTAVADISNAAASMGLATAKTTGTTTISATDAISGKVGQTQLTVSAAQLISISVAAPAGAGAKIPMGYSALYTATGLYSDGSQQNLTATANWLSSDPSAATAGNSSGNKGVITGIAVGTSTVTASLNGVMGTAAITISNATLSVIAVTPANATIHPNGTLQYSAVGTFSDTTTLSLTQQVTWSSSNTLAATISNTIGSQGLATSGALIGTTTISAAVNGITASTQLTRALN